MSKLTPQMAARNFCDAKIKEGFQLVALHEYQDITGIAIFWRIRLKNPATCEKIIWPMHQDKNGKFFLKEPDFNLKRKPIYRIPAIHNNPGQPIYIHEGEKCVDEFAKLGLIATTSGGWNSAANADWEILKGRKVIIWRDADEQGLQYAINVTDILLKLNCEVWWIDIEKLNLPPKGDCVDWLIKIPQPSPNEILSLPLIKPLSQQQEIKNSLSSSEIEPDDKNSDFSKAKLLLNLIEGIEFFHDEQKQSYAMFKNIDHQEIWPIESDEFKNWLAHQFWNTYKTSISHTSLNDVLSTIKGKATFEGECHQVFMRVGNFNEKIYINIANKKWQAIEVSANGWSILNSCPVRFKGLHNMQPLPMPLENGNVNLLWKHINIPTSAQILVLAWMLECWRPHTPFPLLILMGMQGSGKSHAQEILRKIIDPSLPNLRNAPKNADDILVAAANNLLVSYNNVSKLSIENQDDLCCLSTGGGFARRKFYTTGSEAVIDIKRPVILNGISELITRQDLLDRCIIIDLPTIHEKTRKTDNELNDEFNADYPLILGGLLNIFSKVLRIIPSIQLLNKPRMASFALLGTALEEVLNLEKGSFMQAYKGNYQANMISALENSSIATALINFMQNESEYNTTYSDLLTKLSSSLYRSEMTGWPKSPKGLANILKRQALALEIAGIKIHFEDKPRNDGYHVTLINLKRKIMHKKIC